MQSTKKKVSFAGKKKAAAEEEEESTHSLTHTEGEEPQRTRYCMWAPRELWDASSTALRASRIPNAISRVARTSAAAATHMQAHCTLFDTKPKTRGSASLPSHPSSASESQLLSSSLSPLSLRAERQSSAVG